MSVLNTMAMVTVILINVLVSLSGFRAFQGQGGNPLHYLFIPAQVRHGDNLVGLFVSNFSHANFSHLMFNMLTFYFFAEPILYVENVAGFLFVILFSAMGSDLLIYLMRKNDPDYRCLGASGYVSGVVFAAIVFFPTISIWFIPGPLYALLFVGISIYMMRTGGGGISHEGHIGGAIAGFVAAILLYDDGLPPIFVWLLRLIG
ncbi:MAG: rhomboid family intramembrane serine protease [Leptospiraceae bacterium]|nr:rhomboid family intramembrane serine protease [Leptospiraceae bacterium]MCB1322059.1 rhomboid family intramembrane serine protease [Leptospiraceae bacterium]